MDFPNSPFAWFLNSIQAFFATLFGGNFYVVEDGDYVQYFVPGIFSSILDFVSDHFVVLILIFAPIIIGFVVGFLKRLKGI